MPSTDRSTGLCRCRSSARWGSTFTRSRPRPTCPQVGAVIKRQADLAQSLGFEATPSFSFGNIGILGYPGPDALQKAVADMKRCDKLACG